MISFTIGVQLDLDTSCKEPSHSPHRKPLGTDLPTLLLSSLPLGKSIQGERSLQNLLMRSPQSFRPFSARTLCLHFQGPVCHFGPPPLASIPAWEVQSCIKSCEERWTLCHGHPRAGGRDENSHVPRAGEGFIFCLLMC